MLPDEPSHPHHRPHLAREAEPAADVVVDPAADAAAGSPRSRARAPFERVARVPGFAGSRWGYDGVLECFWAELVAPGGEVVRIGPEHLLTTVPALARAVAHRGHVDPAQAYLALTA